MALKNNQLQHLFQSSLYWPEIIKLNQTLKQKNVDFVFLKGLPLHLHFNHKIPDRLYYDCDLLIKKKDYQQTKKIFEKLDYKKRNKNLTRIQNFLKLPQPEHIFEKKVKNFPIHFDVHTQIHFMMSQLGNLNHLYPTQLIDQLTNQFLANKKIIKLRNHELPILDNENLILYLTLHLFHHNYSGRHRLKFLNQVIKSYQEIDWEKIKSLVNKYQLNNYVYPVFKLVILNDEFLKQIKPEKVKIKLNTLNKESESRWKSGQKRFQVLFKLSPLPLYRRLLVFIKPIVLFLIISSLANKLGGKLFEKQSTLKNEKTLKQKKV
jgi:hypothetical protein